MPTFILRINPGVFPAAHITVHPQGGKPAPQPHTTHSSIMPASGRLIPSAEARGLRRQVFSQPAMDLRPGQLPWLAHGPLSDKIPLEGLIAPFGELNIAQVIRKNRKRQICRAATSVPPAKARGGVDHHVTKWATVYCHSRQTCHLRERAGPGAAIPGQLFGCSAASMFNTDTCHSHPHSSHTTLPPPRAGRKRPQGSSPNSPSAAQKQKAPGSVTTSLAGAKPTCTRKGHRSRRIPKAGVALSLAAGPAIGGNPQGQRPQRKISLANSDETSISSWD